MNIARVLLTLGILLLAGSFWASGEAVIQLYDTYFVISWSYIFQWIGLFCGLIGGIYFLQNRRGLNRY